VRIRIVVDPAAGPVGITGVVLIWPHDSADDVTAPAAVEDRDRGPESGDLHHQFGAVASEEFPVGGGLEILPDVVCDGRTDMSLKMGGVRQPASGDRVEV